MTPPTVNAYYDPSYNTINFPAGIIQPTFFDSSYPMYVNFAGIGMVMGHELIHGFDDQGRQYDGTGMLKQWWTDNVVRAFESRASCLVSQYSKFKVGNNFVNGNLTLGENIADNGGLRAAYDAFVSYEQQNGPGPTLPVTDKSTNQQLFFLAFAQSWCQLISPESAQNLIFIDPHSPAFARVNGPLQNYDKFAAAYNCPVGSSMNPTAKCQLW